MISDYDDNDVNDDEEVHDDDFTPELQQSWDQVASAVSANHPDVDMSSSSSTSSSSTDSDNDIGQDATRTDKAGVPVEEANTQVRSSGAGFSRDVQNHFDFGKHFMVARKKGNVVTGYHMTCKHDPHGRCTKEMSSSVGGTLEGTRRVLKAWALLGPSVASRELHMAKGLRDTLLHALKDNTLMSEIELDALAEEVSDDVIQAPYIEPNNAAPAGSQLLGAAGEGVPPEVHSQMEALALSGDIPVTSLEQRRRQRATSNSGYAVPDTLRMALHHGYIGPNLPPPRGLVWQCSGRRWRLSVRGG